MNDEVNHRIQLRAIVSLVTNKLTDEELTTLNLTAHLGTKPRADLLEKAKLLYTADGFMHDETKAALFAIVQERLTG